MKKRILSIVLCVCFLLSIVNLTSCDEFLNDMINIVSEAIEAIDTETDISTYQTNREEPIQTNEKANVIPFFKTPDIVEYKITQKNYADPMEEEASRIIDFAIEKAISYVNAMKDDRHSKVVNGFEEDTNNYVAQLTKEEQNLYGTMIKKAKNGENFSVLQKDYSGNLKDFYFNVYCALTYVNPDVASYFTYDAKTTINASYESVYKEVFGVYYDPNKDGNYNVNNNEANMQNIMHDKDLLDCVIKRIVRYMPDGLSTYDKYYYLASVLSEKVTYDDRTKNCFTAYGALISGKAVCEGYTSAYYLLCREAGLYCAYRDGMPQNVGHTWNMVKIDGETYNVDVTWCDGYGKPYEKSWYRCFVKNDNDFEYDGHNATSGVVGTGTFVPSPYEDY